MDVVISVAHKGKHVEVVETSIGVFDVITNKTVRHPNCDAKAVMRALAMYLHDDSVDI
jgi:hypothetical protein